MKLVKVQYFMPNGDGGQNHVTHVIRQPNGDIHNAEAETEV